MSLAKNQKKQTVLDKSTDQEFHLNGHTLRFHPGVSSTDSKVRTTPHERRLYSGNESAVKR